MKNFFKAKNWLIIFVIAVAIFAAAIGFFIFKFNKNIDIVRAGIGDNVSGFAWSENIGWISFNSTDCDIDGDGTYEGAGEDGGPASAGCPASGAVDDYGVDINPTTGNFSGYAWSNHVGWISFQETGDTADETPPDSYAFNPDCINTCDDTNDCTACYNSTDDNLYGWAKILSLENGGWIKLSGFASDGAGFPISFPISFPLAFSGSAYGVSINSGTGDFSGWAWNANDTGAGIGWVNFNCADEGVCASSDYNVSIIFPPGQPVITSITPVTGFQCSMLKVSWTDVAGETGYRVFRDAVQLPLGSPTDFGDDVFSFTDSGLVAGTAYDYVVQAFNLSDSSDSDSVSGATLSVCEVSGIQSVGTCPNIILLNWAADASADHYEVNRCNETDSECTDEIYSVFAPGDDCFEPIANTCVDNTILDAEAEDYFQYRVRAVSAVPEDGDWSELSDQVQACPGMPTWKEVK